MVNRKGKTNKCFLFKHNTHFFLPKPNKTPIKRNESRWKSSFVGFGNSMDRTNCPLAVWYPVFVTTANTYFLNTFFPAKITFSPLDDLACTTTVPANNVCLLSASTLYTVFSSFSGGGVFMTGILSPSRNFSEISQKKNAC